MGSLSSLSSVEIGIGLMTQLFERAGVDPKTVDQLIFGNGRQAGAGPNPARQIAIGSGMAESSIAYTMNMACASGLKSIVLAAREIERGDADIVVAGGTESMSRLPFLLPNYREGYRMGHNKVVDGMYQDGFHCPMADMLMGATAENLADQYQIDRRAQDEFAVTSQNRSEQARAEGRFDAEILPLEYKTRKGVQVLAHDEHARDGVTLESITKLKAVFRKDGTVHAGNSSGITDGAAALLMMSEAKAKELNLEILAYYEAEASAGVDPKIMGIGPVPATAKLLKKLDITLNDFDLIELNEAFAAQALACMQEWGVDNSKINVNGGAISLGHPIGATGARIVVTLLNELKRQDLNRGLATLCVSGGMGQSVSFRRA